MNASTNHKALAGSIPHVSFDVAVVLTIEGEPVFVDDVSTARACLIERFPDADGPSYRRALAACDASLLGHSSGEVSRIVFVVAAMEAGFPFEVIEDAANALERRTEIEALRGLRSLLLEHVHAE